MPSKVEVRRSAEKEVKKVEEVKRIERRRSIETRKEKSPKKEELAILEEKKVNKKKEDDLGIVEEAQQRRPAVSSPHSGFPTGFIWRKCYCFFLENEKCLFPFHLIYCQVAFCEYLY